MQNLRQHKVVLLVEDDPGDQELVRRSFQREAADVDLRIVGSGAEALDYLARKGSFADPGDAPNPDLMLLDLNLPDMSGLDVLKTVRETAQYSCLPIVILSTSDHPDDIRKSYQRHCNSYLQKPHAYSGYKNTVRDVRQYWLEKNLQPQANG